MREKLAAIIEDFEKTTDRSFLLSFFDDRLNRLAQKEEKMVQQVAQGLTFLDKTQLGRYLERLKDAPLEVET